MFNTHSVSCKASKCQLLKCKPSDSDSHFCVLHWVAIWPVEEFPDLLVLRPVNVRVIKDNTSGNNTKQNSFSDFDFGTVVDQTVSP